MASYLKQAQVVKTLNRAKINKVNSCGFDGIYTIATTASYSIGIAIPKGSLKKKIEYVDEEDIRFLQHINSLISGFPDNQRIPFNRFVEIAEVINEKQIAIFLCGQKFLMRDLPFSFEDLVTKGTLEVAIAREFHLPGKFLCVSSDSNIDGIFYSNFLSNIACNYLQTEKTIRTANSKGIFRTCAYNTFQHARKWIEKRVNFNSVDYDAELDTTNYWQVIVNTYMNNFKSILPNISRTKLRQEFYLVYRNYEDFNSVLSKASKILDDFKIVSIDESRLLQVLIGKFNDLEMFVDDANFQGNDYIEILIIVLFFKCYSSFFCITPISKKFIMSNYGIGISSTCVTEDLKLTDRFFKEYPFTEFRHMVDSLLERNAANKNIYYYLLLLYFSAELKVTGDFSDISLVIATLCDVITQVNVKKSNIKNIETEIAKEFKHFIIFVSSKMERKSSIFLRKSWKMALKFLEIQTVYDGLKRSAKILRVNFYHERILYFIADEESVIKVNLPFEKNINITSIVKFVKYYKPYFMLNCNIDQLPQVFDSNNFFPFVNFLTDSFKSYVDNTKIGKNFEEQATGVLDPDLFLRLLFAHIPLEAVNENVQFMCIPEFFNSSEWLFKFMLFVQIIYDNINTKYAFDLFLKNMSYPLTKHIQLTKDIAPRVLMYYTGCFEPKLFSPEINNGFASVPFNFLPKLYFEKILIEAQRYNFFFIGNIKKNLALAELSETTQPEYQFRISDLLKKKKHVVSNVMGFHNEIHENSLQDVYATHNDEFGADQLIEYNASSGDSCSLSSESFEYSNSEEEFSSSIGNTVNNLPARSIPYASAASSSNLLPNQ